MHSTGVACELLLPSFSPRIFVYLKLPAMFSLPQRIPAPPIGAGGAPDPAFPDALEAHSMVKLTV